MIGCPTADFFTNITSGVSSVAIMTMVVPKDANVSIVNLNGSKSCKLSEFTVAQSLAANDASRSKMSSRALPDGL